MLVATIDKSIAGHKIVKGQVYSEDFVMSLIGENNYLRKSDCGYDTTYSHTYPNGNSSDYPVTIFVNVDEKNWQGVANGVDPISWNKTIWRDVLTKLAEMGVNVPNEIIQESYHEKAYHHVNLSKSLFPDREVWAVTVTHGRIKKDNEYLIEKQTNKVYPEGSVHDYTPMYLNGVLVGYTLSIYDETNCMWDFIFQPRVSGFDWNGITLSCDESLQVVA